MAMSSLVPGVLFKNTGLNQRHTPTHILAEKDNIKSNYRRSSIPMKEWPPESPTARIYDVGNSSSRLILLNNKLDKASHLRVQSGRYDKKQGKQQDRNDNRVIEPERHFRSSSPPNPDRHVICHDSSSPCFTPDKVVGAEHRCYSASPRRVVQSSGDAGAGDWHHYSSQVGYRVYSAPPSSPRRRRYKSSELVPPPSFKNDAGWLLHPEMTKGQKRYAHSIARIYDMTNMKQLKQAQYIQLIYHEQQRGFFTPENYRKYLIYLNGERKRQFGVSAPPSALASTRNRQKSGHPAPQSARSKEPTGKPESPRSKETDGNKSEERRKVMPRPPSRTRSPSRSSSNRSASKVRVSGDSAADSRTKKDKSPTSSDKYWKQPAKPEKEKEPTGEGLTMMKNKELDLEGETIRENSRNIEENK